MLRGQTFLHHKHWLLTFAIGLVLLSPIGPALAVPMENIRTGLEGIPWERLSPNRINS